MKTLLLILVLIGTRPARADDAKIRQALEKGIVTGQFLQTLTPDDVPDKWKAQEETTDKENYVVHTYSRGGVRVLAVQWPKSQKPEQQKFFVATLFHGERRLAVITRLSDSVSVMPYDAPKAYKVFTSIKDDGTISITVLKDAFFESIVLQGRETHPIDDLDYTKTALSMEGISKPIIETIQEKMDKKPAKKPEE